MRISSGDTPLNPHVYLHEWQLKSELSNKARAYDRCPTAYVSILQVDYLHNRNQFDALQWYRVQNLIFRIERLPGLDNWSCSTLNFT